MTAAPLCQHQAAAGTVDDGSGLARCRHCHAWYTASHPDDPGPGEPDHDDYETPVNLDERRRERSQRREEPTGVRHVRLVSAAGIKPKRARWLWHHKIPLGELTLLAGREGIGKSTVAYTIVADITRGTLRGQPRSTPRNCVIAATEDSWEHTIVPRLMAAGADLNRVFRIEVIDAVGRETVLTLPKDLEQTEHVLTEHRVALLLLDPLMSRLSATLDTHKDSEVRQGLEPLVEIGHRTGTSILGLIHVSKATTRDPLTAVMGSRAFAAVARAVVFAMSDPADRQTTLLGLAKSNLGPSNLPTMTFTIHDVVVAQDDEDGSDISIGRIEWGPDREDSVREVMEQDSGTAEARTAVAEAADWLEDHLRQNGGTDKSADIKRKGAAAGHDKNALDRARIKLRVESKSEGFPRITWWSLP